jgi:UDPglucose 6-dehydrogenase
VTALGWLGLGKLGLTCAAVLSDAGHHVAGYDVSPWAADVLAGQAPPPHEDGFDALDASRLRIATSVEQVVEDAHIVFVAVQTPHAPAYGGETPAPAERRDFEYGHLVSAVRQLARAAAAAGKHITVVVVSTVLPGTCDRLLRPLLNRYTTLVYNPFFIAMGTTVADFRNPEFVLLGADRPGDAAPVQALYRTLHDRPHQLLSIASAELTKVAYNTFISMKIVWANALMELCHKTAADCDQVVDALSLATDRVISPKYLRGGMGDGGHCHPRDLIAMSWLAQRLDLSYDLLGELATAREAQSAWLARLVAGWCEQTGLRPVVLGKAYKPDSPLVGGSPALLLAHQLAQAGLPVRAWDPHVDIAPVPPLDIVDGPRVYVIGARQPEFPTFDWPHGSVVIDPWGYIPDRPGVTVVRVGRKN